VIKATTAQLTEVQVEGQRAWALSKEGALRKSRRGESVRLLPAFDVYVAATRPRASLVDRRFEDLVFRRAGWISPVVAVDGWINGVWKHERSAGSIEITVQPFDRLSASQRKKIGAEADRLGHFLDAPAVIEFVGAA
jgi:Winged helix DNA-binding domain